MCYRPSQYAQLKPTAANVSVVAGVVFPFLTLTSTESHNPTIIVITTKDWLQSCSEFDKCFIRQICDYSKQSEKLEDMRNLFRQLRDACLAFMKFPTRHSLGRVEQDLQRNVWEGLTPLLRKF